MRSVLRGVVVALGMASATLACGRAADQPAPPAAPTAPPIPSPAAPAPPSPAAGGNLASVVGVWQGTSNNPATGTATPVTMTVRPDGSYVALIAGTSVLGTLHNEGATIAYHSTASHGTVTVRGAAAQRVLVFDGQMNNGSGSVHNEYTPRM